MARLSEVGALQTDRQTDRQTDATENVIMPHLWVVKIKTPRSENASITGLLLHWKNR